MSENKRRLYYVITDPSVFIIMEIGTTDSHILQLHKHLIILRYRDRALFKAHLSDAVHHGYFHCTFHNDTPPRSFKLIIE